MPSTRTALLTRRRWLSLLVFAVGSAAAILGVRLYSLDEDRFVPLSLRPRHRGKRPPRIVRVMLPEGFYLNPKPRTPIIHYVDSNGTIHRVGRIRQERLKPTQPAAASAVRQAMIRSALPHINLSNAGFALETAARARLQRSASDTQAAIELLETGVQYDILRMLRASRQTLKEGNRVVPVKVRPNFRIYDLLAALSVRAGRDDLMTRMLTSVKQLPPELSGNFETRLEKWTNRSSPWYIKRSAG